VLGYNGSFVGAQHCCAWIEQIEILRIIRNSPLSFGEKKAAERNAREIGMCSLKVEFGFRI
jgi:hypothetical protein